MKVLWEGEISLCWIGLILFARIFDITLYNIAQGYKVYSQREIYFEFFFWDKSNVTMINSSCELLFPKKILNIPDHILFDCFPTLVVE